MVPGIYPAKRCTIFGVTNSFVLACVLLVLRQRRESCHGYIRQFLRAVRKVKGSLVHSHVGMP